MKLKYLIAVVKFNSRKQTLNYFKIKGVGKEMSMNLSR